MLGLTTSAYIAYDIITAAVNVEATGTDRYANYGIYGILGSFLGLFQGMWVVAFLGLAAAVAMAPVKLALDFNAKGVAVNEALFYHTLQAITAYVGYSSVTEAKAQLFSIWDTGAYGGDYGTEINSDIGLLWDLINHTITAMAYSFVAFAIALGPFLYAEFLMDPTMFPGWAQKYALE